MHRFKAKFTLFTFFLFQAFFWSPSIYAIRTSDLFAQDHYERIRSAIDNFLDLPQSNSSEEVAFLLENETPKKWLTDRIHYLLPKFEKAKWSYTLSEDVMVYPNSQLVISDHSNNENTPTSAKSLMSNLGANLYEIGKRKQKLLTLNLGHYFSEVEELPITSPRVGLVTISPYYFSEDLYVSETGDQLADSISLISFLFHEARHSDGSGKELGFPHSLCPDSSDYAGLQVCDQAYNGPYGISSLMLKELGQQCEDQCSEVESEVLKLMYFDFQQRIMNDNAMTLEKKEKINDIQNTLDLFYQELYYQKKNEEIDQLQVHLINNLIFSNEQKLKVLLNTELLNHTYWVTTPEKLILPTP